MCGARVYGENLAVPSQGSKVGLCCLCVAPRALPAQQGQPSGLGKERVCPRREHPPGGPSGAKGWTSISGVPRKSRVCGLSITDAAVCEQGFVPVGIAAWCLGSNPRKQSSRGWPWAAIVPVRAGGAAFRGPPCAAWSVGRLAE